LVLAVADEGCLDNKEVYKLCSQLYPSALGYFSV
jgi:hypothetical protein